MRIFFSFILLTGACHRNFLLFSLNDYVQRSKFLSFWNKQNNMRILADTSENNDDGTQKKTEYEIFIRSNDCDKHIQQQRKKKEHVIWCHHIYENNTYDIKQFSDNPVKQWLIFIYFISFLFITSFFFILYIFFSCFQNNKKKNNRIIWLLIFFFVCRCLCLSFE